MAFSRWLVLLLLAVSFSSRGISGFEVQGHRGNSALRPENTIPAFSRSIEAGVDVLELDILATSDGHLVIYHDFFINDEHSVYLNGQPIEGEVLVRSLTLEELKKIDIGLKVNPDFPRQASIPGTQIPTFQELLDFINTTSLPHGKKIRLNIDLKRDPRFPEWTLPPHELAIKLTSQVRKSGLESRVYYSSFDPEILAAIREADPLSKRGFIVAAQSLEVASILQPQAGIDFLLKIADLVEAEVLSPEHVLLQSKEEVLSLQKRGFRVIPWTVNDLSRIEELVDMGVDGIISDDPERVMQFLEQKKKTP